MLKILYLGFIVLLMTINPLLAQSNDVYWQKLIGAKEAQSAQQIVDMARALDTAQARIDELAKQLEAEKAKSREPKK